jgi:hypothetical protein
VICCFISLAYLLVLYDMQEGGSSSCRLTDCTSTTTNRQPGFYSDTPKPDPASPSISLYTRRKPTSTSANHIMDRPLTSELRPTKPPSTIFTPEDVHPKLEHAKESILTARLQQQSAPLLDRPYDPSGWIARSATLTTLGFPELAVGDAHKVTRLCGTMLAFLDSRPDENWSLGSSCGFWMRDDSETTRNEGQGREEQLRTSLHTFSLQASQLQASNYRYKEHKEGKYVPQEYPWLEARYRGRSQNVLDDIATEIANNEVTTVAGLPCIEVKRCTFRPGEEDESDGAALGIFTTCDLKKGTKILVDRTDFFGCNGPGPKNCGANLGGGQGCLHPIHPNIGADEVEHDLRWVRERAGSHAADPLLICRVLMACARANLESPLDLPAIARLTATYYRQAVKTFRLDRDFSIINDALELFGFDIFANQKYDTWVLFTLSAILSNNSWTNPMSVSLNPLFSLFNHSCEPNVDWATQKDHRTVVMRVSKDAAAGEQLFVEYDGFEHDKPVHERRQRLTRWIDGLCMCSRCVREEQELRDLRSGDDQMQDGQIADVS